MKVLVILGHPQPESFNHAIADTAVAALENDGHEVIYHDLQAEGFDPILPGQEIARDGLMDRVVMAHCDQLAATDGVVIVHPNWWGQPPAVLKGWIDRVFRPGVAVKDFYRRNFGVIVTSTPEQRAEWLRDLEEILRKAFPRESQGRGE